MNNKQAVVSPTNPMQDMKTSISIIPMELLLYITLFGKDLTFLGLIKLCRLLFGCRVGLERPVNLDVLMKLDRF